MVTAFVHVMENSHEMKRCFILAANYWTVVKIAMRFMTIFYL